MASSAIDFAIGRIISVIENEALSLSGVRDEVNKIRVELVTMKLFLEEAERTGYMNAMHKPWINNIRDLAYQVEDVIAEFTYHSQMHQSFGPFWRKIRFLQNLWVRHRMAAKLEKINVTIQTISEVAKRYDLKISEPAASPDRFDKKWVKNHGESCLFFDDDSLIGIDEAKRKLIQWLVDDKPQRTVVSVVGMGGSGKTTIAANTFKSQIVRKHFSCYAWITVSQSYAIEDLFRAMIKEFYKEANEDIPADLSSMGYRQLVEMLVSYLQTKRYFVVLDDVWSKNLWREISVALPDGIHGSRIIITTRNESIASFRYGAGCQIHKIEPLKKEEAWALFCKKAFSGNPDACSARNIVLIARELLEKCQGLPLAIVSLGSMMSAKKFESEWRNVCNTLNWELSNNPELKVIRTILLLSYHDLPYPLKRCFLYCCASQKTAKSGGKD